MNLDRVNKLSEQLSQDTYDLAKSIDALRYRVVPPDVDLKDDYVLTFMGLLSNQAKMINDMTTRLNDLIENLEIKEWKNEKCR